MASVPTVPPFEVKVVDEPEQIDVVPVTEVGATEAVTLEIDGLEKTYKRPDPGQAVFELFAVEVEEVEALVETDI